MFHCIRLKFLNKIAFLSLKIIFVLTNSVHCLQKYLMDLGVASIFRPVVLLLLVLILHVCKGEGSGGCVWQWFVCDGACHVFFFVWQSSL